MLKAAQENLDRKSQLEAEGYSFDWLVERVARQLEIEPKDVLAPGKYVQSVKASKHWFRSDRYGNFLITKRPRQN